MEFPKSAVALSRIRRVAPIAIGALGGYAYYYFIGCASGTCPISSNPWISTAYGMLIGGIITMGPKNKTSEKKEG